jgi:hypothetical protein
MERMKVPLDALDKPEIPRELCGAVSRRLIVGVGA